MKLIAPKYRQLRPTVNYLCDEVVMAQAWKKTHGYIRAHNWYSDTLALDVSALSLEGSIKNWTNSIINKTEKLNKIELIPAAKSDKWIVDSNFGWIPLRKKNFDKKVPLRPLAHLTVRDQTWATAALLCLADIVETAQGDCSGSDVIRHQKKKVYSYGNRLLCDWNEDGKAWFRWGNSEIYRKFFVDYQCFLKRPVVIGGEVALRMQSADLVFVVSLDLSKFYDNIDRQKLIGKLRKLSGRESDIEQSSEFWSALKKIFDWRWGEDDKVRAEQLQMSIVDGQGIPQGLVAAGFYANAYMLDFDQKVGSFIGDEPPGCKGITLHDYCRYVDDLRLVISIDKAEDYDKVGVELVTWLNQVLMQCTDKNLQFNIDKTRVTALSDLANKGSLSERVAQLQSELSGPADRDLLDSAMGALEGLLAMSSEEIPELVGNPADARLVKIAKFDHVIRGDTLKRFAANRLETIMRNKRKIDAGSGIESVQDIDNQSELLAKKLIWAWMQDPSLALVLRKALEIFPSAEMAEPIFDAILTRCSFYQDEEKDATTAAMMDYLIADLFRSCIDLHGYFQRIDYPRTSNPEQLLELACYYAQKILATELAPVFVERQALLLLAVKQKHASLKSSSDTIHHHLHALLSGKIPPWKRQLLALYEVAAQITGMPDSIATQFVDAAEELSEGEQKLLLEDLAKRGGPFWLSVWSRLFKSKFSKNAIDSVYWASPSTVHKIRGNKIQLENLISSRDTPFFHEAALVKLAMLLVEEIQKNYSLVGKSPAQIQIKKTGNSSWSKLPFPANKLAGLEVLTPFRQDPRFDLPSWLVEDDESRAIYWIGCILRSAAIGVTDFTSNRWKSGVVQSYKGLRTGWYKRRMGMMHAPEALVGEFATLSSWASELLMKCLQWPGFESSHLVYEDVASIGSLESLNKVLEERLNQLNNLFCNAVETPALITRAKRPKNRHEKGFRLVSVQQLLPKVEDFNASDPKLDNPIVRSVNRDHLAKICQITYRTLQAKLSAENKESYPGADIIVFAELAVHPDDQDLIKRLADKTQSIVFAGLGFQEHEDSLINVARWYIPDYRETGRQWVIRDQGKQNPTNEEKPLGVKGYRPCQHIIEVFGDSEGPFYVSGAICYDATDLKLAADLKCKTDLFIVVAHNKDVSTFDTMASALNYHMYQHVVVVNKGEFGGSTIQAPYRERHDRLISHAHGNGQISINVADIDLAAFKRKTKSLKTVKTPPAG